LSKLYIFFNIQLVAVGWGRLSENGPVPSILQQVVLKAIDYRNYTCYPMVYDRSKQFCAGVENSLKGKAERIHR
jgi:hypothetical protein